MKWHVRYAILTWLEMSIAYFSLIMLHNGNFNNQNDAASLTTASMITKVVPNFHYTTTNKNAIRLFSLYASIYQSFVLSWLCRFLEGNGLKIKYFGLQAMNFKILKNKWELKMYLIIPDIWDNSEILLEDYDFDELQSFRLLVNFSVQFIGYHNKYYAKKSGKLLKSKFIIFPSTYAFSFLLPRL